jgi:rhodanese-related sulfurtransferase
VKGATNATLDVFRDEIVKVEKKVKVYCGGGVRAKIAASLLKSLKYDVIYCNVGFSKIVEDAKVDVEKP